MLLVDTIDRSIIRVLRSSCIRSSICSFSFLVRFRRRKRERRNLRIKIENKRIEAPKSRDHGQVSITDTNK